MSEENYSSTFQKKYDLRATGLRSQKDILTKIKTVAKFFGPAFVVSVAYIDPGNFATNISGGSKFNYTLLWVILWSNLMAIFLQSMSAKLGIATGYNLPQMCGKVFSKKVNWCFWILAEIAAMATNLAEFLGSTLGLTLLFRMPVICAGLITAILTFLLVWIGKYGQRKLEFAISILISIICISYALELFLAKPDWELAGMHLLIPSLPNADSIFIAVGMLGATVMPHVIYLHSQLVQHRNQDLCLEKKKRHLKLEIVDITIAMNIAFLVNASMVIVSAAVFYRNSTVVDTIEQAHQSLMPLLGAASSGAFGLALIASGLSSSAVGTLAGQTIMQGFVGLHINDTLSRIVTMLPGIIIIIIGLNPMMVLVLSQVILSFILPLAIIPMVLITSRKDLMGEMVNKPITKVIGWLITGIIVIANGALLFFTLFRG